MTVRRYDGRKDTMRLDLRLENFLLPRRGAAHGAEHPGRRARLSPAIKGARDPEGIVACFTTASEVVVYAFNNSSFHIILT